jgi:hypothetical protein
LFFHGLGELPCHDLPDRHGLRLFEDGGGYGASGFGIGFGGPQRRDHGLQANLEGVSDVLETTS